MDWKGNDGYGEMADSCRLTADGLEKEVMYAKH